MTTDPDQQAMSEAAAALKTILADHKSPIGKDLSMWAAAATVTAWLKRRAYSWAVMRGKARFGEPDAYTMGFALAALPQIADATAGLPFDKPIGAWSHDDAARLFAIAHLAIEATAEQTLEQPGDEPELAA